MNIFKVSADKIFDGYSLHGNAQLVVKNGYIDTIEAIDGSAQQHITGMISPGFVDLQVNGGGGALFNEEPSLKGLQTIVKGHRQFGTTSMMPTLITDRIEVMEQAANSIAIAIESGITEILGIHFEGPHLSKMKKGAHCAEFIRPISDAEWDIFSRKDIGKIIVTVAPENIAINDIKRMVSLGIKVCLGHSNADYETVQAALNAGADGFTHLFNAMSAFEARAPGMVGAALINDHCACGLIVDGHHVDYTACKIALKSKPKGKLYLVTDAMSTVGTNMTEFELFNRQVIRSNGQLKLASGELAGSTLDMASAVRNTHKNLGVSITEAIAMASIYPAVYLGVDSRLGHIRSGAHANFLVFDNNNELVSVWIDGALVN